MFDEYPNHQSPTTQPATPQKVVRFDKGYVKTLPGLLKVAELVCNTIGFICIKLALTFFSAIFYNILYWVGNVVTLLLLLAYMFHLVEKLDQWPWLKAEFFYCGVMVLAYIGTSIFATALGESAGYAAGFFGLCAILAYAADGFLKYKAWKRGLPPQ